jgi:hypothetical protein
MSTQLSGKGRRTDIALLKLLLEQARPLTLWKMTEVDGDSQNNRERKERVGMYRRAILGRKDSDALGLVQRGYVKVSQRRVRGKVRKVFSITKEGVKALLGVELIDFGRDFFEGLLERKEIDTIAEVSLKTGIDPISLVRIYFNEEGLKILSQIVNFAVKEFPYHQEFANFYHWLKKAEPDLYKEWTSKHLRISEVIRKARPEVIEKIKKTFPLNSARWGL